jgi:putative redox protein
MSAFLLACGGCTGVDAVLILKKMRVRLAKCSVDVVGVRRTEEPRRYTAIKFLFRLAGEGLDVQKAQRAVALSLEKYCSAIHSLAPDTDVGYEIEVA